jgi:hypothetical protein
MHVKDTHKNNLFVHQQTSSGSNNRAGEILARSFRTLPDEGTTTTRNVKKMSKDNKIWIAFAAQKKKRKTESRKKQSKPLLGSNLRLIREAN